MPADTHLMELQSPRNVVLHTDGQLYEVLAALDKAKPNTGLKRGSDLTSDLTFSRLMTYIYVVPHR